MPLKSGGTASDTCLPSHISPWLHLSQSPLVCCSHRLPFPPPMTAKWSLPVQSQSTWGITADRGATLLPTLLSCSGRGSCHCRPGSPRHLHHTLHPLAGHSRQQWYMLPPGLVVSKQASRWELIEGRLSLVEQCPICPHGPASLGMACLPL